MAVFLHTRIRVSDLDNSISFYSERLGFKLLSRSERSPHGNQIAHLELPRQPAYAGAYLLRRL